LLSVKKYSINTEMLTILLVRYLQALFLSMTLILEMLFLYVAVCLVLMVQTDVLCSFVGIL